MAHLAMAARTPAAHIIQNWEPNPYHISCSISNRSPTMIVCFAPIVFMRRVSRPVCRQWESVCQNPKFDSSKINWFLSSI